MRWDLPAARTPREHHLAEALAERNATAQQIIARLRPKLARVPGSLYPAVSRRMCASGGRQSGAEYQFSMQGDNFDDLLIWSPKMLDKLKTEHDLADVNMDLQNQGLQEMVTYDRATAARFNIAPQLIDDTLYDAFGQRGRSRPCTCRWEISIHVDNGSGAAILAGSFQILNEIYVELAGMARPWCR